jgi:hypothetical protein
MTASESDTAHIKHLWSCNPMKLIEASTDYLSSLQIAGLPAANQEALCGSISQMTRALFRSAKE